MKDVIVDDVVIVVRKINAADREHCDLWFVSRRNFLIFVTFGTDF